MFYGTSLFASINAHDKLQASRWDDLESTLYMLLLFYCGNLPWLNKIPLSN